MTSLNQEQKVLTIIGIGVTAALVIVGAVLVPTIRSVQQSNKEVYDLRLYLEQKHDRSINARMAVKQIDTIKESMSGLEKYIFKSGDELQLITLLEDLSNRHEVVQKIKSSNLDAIANQRITMALNLTGTYRSMMNYLQALEQADYFVSLNRLSMTTFADRSKPGANELVSFDVDITLYVAN